MTTLVHFVLTEQAHGRWRFSLVVNGAHFELFEVDAEDALDAGGKVAARLMATTEQREESHGRQL